MKQFSDEASQIILALVDRVKIRDEQKQSQEKQQCDRKSQRKESASQVKKVGDRIPTTSTDAGRVDRLID